MLPDKIRGKQIEKPLDPKNSPSLPEEPLNPLEPLEPDVIPVVIPDKYKSFICFSAGY